MTPVNRPEASSGSSGPWWASGREPDDGLDDDDPFDAHRRARAGAAPHDDADVCNACPVCMALRALHGSHPEVITHLADAAHHLSLALQALADPPPPRPAEDVEHIDLDP